MLTSPGVQQRLVKMAKFCQKIGNSVQIHVIRVIQVIHAEKNTFMCISQQPRPQDCVQIFILRPVDHSDVNIDIEQMDRWHILYPY